jgi:hypothetical protein
VEGGAYRAVPLAPLSSSTMQSAGGLTEGAYGYPLWHIWGQGAPGSPSLVNWRTYSD